MDALIRDRRLTAFRATDAFAVEAYRTASRLSGAHELTGEIRRAALRAGGAVVAASAVEPGGEPERRRLETARDALSEGRYFLYLARRFGLLDQAGYRALTVRHDAALREIEALLAPGGSRKNPVRGASGPSRV